MTLAGLLLYAMAWNTNAVISNFSEGRTSHSLFISANNHEVFTMGVNNSRGFMGVYAPSYNTTPFQKVPITTGIIHAKSVVATQLKSYVLTEGKEVYVWGTDTITNKSANTPLKFSLSNVIDMAATEKQVAFVIDNDGDGVGSLMVSDLISDKYYPDMTDIVQIAAGWSNYTQEGFFIILKKDGTVYAMGANSRGQLGVGDLKSRADPVRVAYLTHVVAISAGAAHSIALHDDGTISTWGENVCDSTVSPSLLVSGPFSLAGCAKLGYVNKTNTYVPQKVPGITDVIKVSAGFYDTTLLTKEHTIMVTGFHNYSFSYQCLGINPGRPIVPPPPQLCPNKAYQGVNLFSTSFMKLPVFNVADVTGTGVLHFITLNDGTLTVWGRMVPFGDAGDGSGNDSYFPVNVAPAAPVSNYKVILDGTPKLLCAANQTIINGVCTNNSTDNTQDCKNGYGYGDTNHCHIKTNNVNKGN